MAFIGLFSALLIILFAVCPAKHFATNSVDEFGYRDALNNDAIVYVWDKQGSSSASEKLRVYDQYAYRYFATVDNDFAFNKTLGAYEKDFYDTNGLLGNNYSLPEITKTENGLLRITAYGMGTESLIDVTFTNVENVTLFRIISSRERYEIENDGKGTFRLQIPYDENDFADFTVEFEHEVDINVGVEYYQYVSGELTVLRMKNAEGAYKEINSVLDRSKIGKEIIDYDTDNDSNKDIPCGMIFHRQDSFGFEA